MLKRVGLKMGTWFRKNIIDPLLQIIRRGAEPKQLAFSGALGIALGIFPICGVTIFLCGLAIALLGSVCHAPTVMLANFISTPIELSLIIPFLRFGEAITSGSHFPLTFDALKKVFTGEASHELFLSILRAISSMDVEQPLLDITPSSRSWSCKIIVIEKLNTRQARGNPGIAYKPVIMQDSELLGWIVAAPFILGILYVVLLPCFAIEAQGARCMMGPVNPGCVY